MSGFLLLHQITKFLMAFKEVPDSLNSSVKELLPNSPFWKQATIKVECTSIPMAEEYMALNAAICDDPVLTCGPL
jgi:hypothetical protein